MSLVKDRAAIFILSEGVGNIGEEFATSQSPARAVVCDEAFNFMQRPWAIVK